MNSSNRIQITINNSQHIVCTDNSNSATALQANARNKRILIFFFFKQSTGNRITYNLV